MHILVTGAGGFVGRALAERLLTHNLGLPGQADLKRLTLLDLEFADPHPDQRVVQIQGNLSNGATLDAVFDAPSIDCVFHLASVPGGLAEREYQLGRQVNLDATLDLLERLSRQVPTARVVFASTIAVYGAAMPSIVTDDTPLKPGMSYGAQKLIGEILLEDFSRRGWIDGRALRLPGIVARPPQPSGLLSAFMSDMFWRLKAGEPFDCPVSPDAIAWWMSVGCCVDNLIHAAILPAEAFSQRRALAIPVLRLTVAQVVDGLVARFGEDRRALVTYLPNDQLEAAFGRFPELHANAATALGFKHDGHLMQLIERATAG